MEDFEIRLTCQIKHFPVIEGRHFMQGLVLNVSVDRRRRGKYHNIEPDIFPHNISAMWKPAVLHNWFPNVREGENLHRTKSVCKGSDDKYPGFVFIEVTCVAYGDWNSYFGPRLLTASVSK
jgi:hypothetical protein